MIKSICVCSPEETKRNHKFAAGRGLPWLVASPERGRPLAVVGGGPSAGGYLDTILSWPGDILAINGAYNWLQDAGRVPKWAMMLDPQPFPVLFARAKPETQWLVASTCDPSTFDALSGCPVTLWLAPQNDEEIQPGDIPGGPTAMSRAPVLAAVLGYRDISLFGADSCYSGETTHVYGATLPGWPTGIPAHAFHIYSNGRVWLTDLGWLAQAEYLAEMIPVFPFPVRLMGDHLASALLASQEWKLAA